MYGFHGDAARPANRFKQLRLLYPKRSPFCRQNEDAPKRSQKPEDLFF
jgi:hypothetical protein